MNLAQLSDATRQYIAQARSHTPLSLEEELELGRRIQSGDLAARNQLFEHNLSLVTGAALEMADTFGSTLGPAVDIDDMIQVGNMALWDATLAYEPELGRKFGTLAVPRIKARIVREMNLTGRLVRVPDRTVEAGAFLSRATRALEQALGRTPTQEELLTYVGEQISTSQARNAQTANTLNQVVELDAPIDSEDATPFGALIEDPDADFREAILEDMVNPSVLGAIARLPKMQRLAIAYRFRLGEEGRLPPRTFTEIGTLLRERHGINVTKQNINNAYHKGMAILKRRLKNEVQ